ncbi:MAG: hypothetical protein OXR73_10850 [Myxococcales bacterium]|nr:hypothetical protein [Myxococcales bacterium]
MAVDDPGHLTPSTGGQPKRWRSSEQVLLDGQDRLYVAEEAPARVSRHTLDSDESEELYTAEDD